MNHNQEFMEIPSQSGLEQQQILSESQEEDVETNLSSRSTINQTNVNRARTYLNSLSTNPFNDKVYEKFGLFVLLLTAFSTSIGYLKECRQAHHDFLLCWGLFYLLTCGKFKSSLVMNLFLFIWGNCQLFSNNHCSFIITVNIICVLLTNLQFYILIVIMIISILAIALLCLLCVFKIRTLEAAVKKNKQQAYKSITKLQNIDKTLECSICFQKQLDSKLKCGHYFHQGCIKNWLQTKLNCPICRSQLC